MIPSRPLSLVEIISETFAILAKIFWRYAVLFIALALPGFALVTTGASDFSSHTIGVAQHDLQFSDTDMTALRNDFNAALVAGNPAMTMQTLPGTGDAYPHASTTRLYHFLRANIDRFSTSVSFILCGFLLTLLGLFAAASIAVELTSQAFEERELRVKRALGSAWARHVWAMLLLYILFVLFWNFDAVFALLPGAVGEALTGLALFAQIYCVIRFSITVPALVSEELGPFAALRRSWELTRGSGWRIVGYAFAIGSVLFVAMIVLAMMLAIAFHSSMTWWNDFLTRPALSISWFLSSFPDFFRSAAIEIAMLLLCSIGMLAVFGTVLYYDLRTRVDGPLVYLENESD